MMGRRRRGGVMSEGLKYELAKDLGFYDKVEKEGWGGITTKDAGNMVKRALQIAESAVSQKAAPAAAQKEAPRAAAYPMPSAPTAGTAGGYPSAAAYSGRTGVGQTGGRTTGGGYSNYNAYARSGMNASEQRAGYAGAPSPYRQQEGITAAYTAGVPDSRNAGYQYGGQTMNTRAVSMPYGQSVTPGQYGAGQGYVNPNGFIPTGAAGTAGAAEQQSKI